MTDPDAHRPGSVRTATFDPETLAELEDLFGRPHLMELLGVLDREIAIRLDPPASEPSRLARDAHVLVSSSGALAFNDLSGACVALEQACLNGAGISAALGIAVHAGRHARNAIASLRAR